MRRILRIGGLTVAAALMLGILFLQSACQAANSGLAGTAWVDTKYGTRFEFVTSQDLKVTYTTGEMTGTYEPVDETHLRVQWDGIDRLWRIDERSRSRMQIWDENIDKGMELTRE